MVCTKKRYRSIELYRHFPNETCSYKTGWWFRILNLPKCISPKKKLVRFIYPMKRQKNVKSGIFLHFWAIFIEYIFNHRSFPITLSNNAGCNWTKWAICGQWVLKFFFTTWMARRSCAWKWILPYTPKKDQLYLCLPISRYHMQNYLATPWFRVLCHITANFKDELLGNLWYLGLGMSQSNFLHLYFVFILYSALWSQFAKRKDA